jgi:hypothetical protein
LKSRRALRRPDKVESRIGSLEFKDGAPSEATLDKVYDHLDTNSTCPYRPPTG